MAVPSAALVVIGHGSHLNPHASTPAFDHAQAIREQQLFSEVREAFWKEEPAIGEVLRTLESEVVYAVPLFMSEGYFTDRIIPRELRLTDDRALDVEKEVHLTAPVGTHEAMAEVIVHRAETITNDPEVGEGVGLAVVGHGTERHARSAASTRAHADHIRERDRFDEVRALFMDEEPAVGELGDHFTSPDVVVVPLFVADGYHTTEDLPEDLGLTDDHREGYDVPATVDGSRVWYAGAVGTDTRIADVILERALEAGATVRPREPHANERVVSEPMPSSGAQVEALGAAADDGVDFDGIRAGADADGYLLETPTQRDEGLTLEAFTDHAKAAPDLVSNWYYWDRVVGDPDTARYAYLRWLERADEWTVAERYDRLADGLERDWGELSITVTLGESGQRRYHVRHAADRAVDRTKLDIHRDPRDASELATFDERGRYRPLKSVPSLQRGWRFPDLTGRELVETVESFYPVSIANWALERAGELDVSHWRETADRQTGMFELVAELPPRAVEWATDACCVDSQCVKRRRWEYDDDRELDVPPGEGAFPCREPCSLFIAGAREWTLIERADSAPAHEELEPRDPDEAREAAFADPANSYRARYLRARRSGEDDESSTDP